jgi:dihydrofolate reductase
MGHHLLMGRKTFESIGRLLPGRTSIVLTRNQRYDAQGALVTGSLQDALRLADGDTEVFVIGGEQIYRLALPSADRMYMTLVHAHIDGDVRFPEYRAGEWTLIEESRHRADAGNVFDYSFRILDRQRGEES